MKHLTQTNNPFINLGTRVFTGRAYGTVTQVISRTRVSVDGVTYPVRGLRSVGEHRVEFTLFPNNAATRDARERSLAEAKEIGRGATVWEQPHATFTSYIVIPSCDVNATLAGLAEPIPSGGDPHAVLRGAKLIFSC